MNKSACLLILCIFMAMACITGSISKTPSLPSTLNAPVLPGNGAGDYLFSKTTLPKVPIPDLSASPDEPVTGTVRIAAFNMKVYGQSKASKPEVMDILAKIIRNYDVVAVQEIRDEKGTALPALVDKVNEEGQQYSSVVGERLGRTSSKEQYAYIFNTSTVMITNPSTYPEPEGTDPFHRQPFMATVDATGGTFDATLIVIHTDPDSATAEINALADVIPYAESAYGDPDVILMGDFNADKPSFKETTITPLHAYTWIIPDSTDTTVGRDSKTFDRIVITDSANAYYTGESGVDRFDVTYGLSPDEAGQVSDHYPVYAVYSTG